MMKEDLLYINAKHESTAKTIFDKVLEEKSKKIIVAVSGESESGKSEISYCLGNLLRDKGIKSKIINMDSFYLVPAENRREWRQRHGVKSIGYNEYDWVTIDKIISDFEKGKKSVMPYYDMISGQLDTLSTEFKDIEVLIINGLYSIKVKEADLKVFIEVTYKDTTEIQEKKKNETLDDWRIKELEREHEVIQSLKGEANFFVDLDTSLKIFHL